MENGLSPEGNVGSRIGSSKAKISSQTDHLHLLKLFNDQFVIVMFCFLVMV